ncbi:MAG: MATE family efflux transporter [Ruminococcaceae bacterium]|nr:MATE family efflux transporter [Oscillospiraceae bacterium]
MDRTEKLRNGSIPKLLFSLAIPSIIAQLVNILYNMVDRIFVGRTPDGNLAMSALSVALPIITFINAVTHLVGLGGAPLAAIKMGAGDKDSAEKIMTTSFVSLISTGIIMTVIIEIFAEPLLYTFGADSTNILLAVEYTRIYAIGTVFVQIAIGMNSYINTQGYAKFGMVTVLIGAVLNIFLDALFINILGMGVKGAALATVISQAVSALWALSFIFGRKSLLKIRKKYIIPEIRVLGSICALGVSPFIMSSTESLLQISFNNQLLAFGGTTAVGAMSILLSLYQMVNMPLQGLCQGAQPILSYNYGADNLERVRKTFKLLFLCCLSFSFVGCGTIVIFSRFFGSIFTSDSEMLQMVEWALRVYLLGGTVFGAQIACQQSFVSLGQAKRSLLMALYRKVFLLIPLIYIMPHLLGGTSLAMNLSLPVAGICIDSSRVFAVLISESVSDVLAALTTTLLFFNFYKNHLK